MQRLDAPQSQSSEQVVAVFSCRTIGLGDTQYQLQSCMVILDQAKILNLSPRLELEGPGNHLGPVEVTRCVSDVANQRLQQ